MKRMLAARWIEAIGFQPRFSDHLVAIKFIWKDFWSELFKKQTDNLKANHRWLARMSVDPSPENKAAQATSMHLNFPGGIIRGALLNFRIPRAVTADISNLPACEY
ncbi:hypothetical protein ACB092_03G068400 [Castanea dentata]